MKYNFRAIKASAELTEEWMEAINRQDFEHCAEMLGIEQFSSYPHVREIINFVLDHNDAEFSKPSFKPNDSLRDFELYENTIQWYYFSVLPYLIGSPEFEDALSLVVTPDMWPAEYVLGYTDRATQKRIFFGVRDICEMVNPLTDKTTRSGRQLRDYESAYVTDDEIAEHRRQAEFVQRMAERRASRRK